jgi:hypothetical protein
VPGASASVVAFALRCRERGEVCTSRTLARQRAASVAEALREDGLEVRTRVRVSSADRSDKVSITLRYRTAPTATWTVVNEATAADPFDLRVEWTTPSGGGVTVLAPGERVRAEWVALDATGRGAVTMSVLDANPGLRVEVRMRGFTGSPICEQAASNGTPFTCMATGARGVVLITPI